MAFRSSFAPMLKTPRFAPCSHQHFSTRMKKPLITILTFCAFSLPCVQAEPFPFKLHKKIRGEVRDTLFGDRDRHRDNDRRHYDRGYSRGYYNDPYYGGGYGYGYGPSFSFQQTVVAEPVYRGRVQREELSLEQQVQVELSKEGFYRGEIDGLIGAGSRDAIRRYQYREDLPVTGRIDRELLEELGII